MDVIDNYYKNALLDGLCNDYKGYWQRTHGEKENLLKLSLSRQAIPHVVTYAYKGKGITKDFVLKEYDGLINGHTVHDADGVTGYTSGLYVDYDADKDLVADKDTMSIMWTRDASIIVPKTKASTMYISNNSKVNIVCEGFNSITIYLFDESHVTLEDIDEESFVIIYKYSKDATVSKGNYCLCKKVKIFDKELKL